MHVPVLGNGRRTTPEASRRTAARGSAAPRVGRLRTRRSRYGVILSVLALLLTLSQVARATYGAYSDTTQNGPTPPSVIDTGTVTVDEDSDGTAMFNMTGMIPGTTASKCINVLYTGSLNASVRLYGALEDAASIKPYLDLVVERSTGAAGGTSHDCTGFVEAGKTTVTTGTTLGAFITSHWSYATGVDTWAPAAAPPTKTASYRFTVTLRDEPTAANKTGTVAFHWESNNL
jgi:hypothetical protein